MKFPNKKIEKILSYSGKVILLLTLMVVVFGPFGQILNTPIVYAIDVGDACTVSVDVLNPVSGTWNGTGCVTANGPGGVTKPGSGQVSDDSGKQVPQDPLECSITNASVCLASVVYAFTVGLGSGLAYVGAFMFDTTVSLSLNSAAYALSFLSSGWTTARDLANMAFILILVYIAFTIMFQAETARTIQMLAWVIFIALIINFSFFFTRVVIDVGNILAVQFYNSIQAPSLQQTMDSTSAQTGVIANTAAGVANAVSPQGSLANTKDLTYSIMQALNLQQLFSNDSFKAFAKQSDFGTKFIVLSFLYLLVGACYFILAAMFLAVSVKFIVRVVVLWFLIIASPLAFICKAVPRPEVATWYDKWQHELVNHAFYPAFFLFIFFFISTIMGSFGGQNDILKSLAESLNAAASNPNLNGFIYIATAVANVGIRLGFVIAMLYIALKASEYMGVKGAGLAHSVTGMVSRAGTGAVFGGAGLAGRYTAGWAGQRIAQNSKLLGANAKGGALGVGAGLLLRTGEGLSKRSFDMRAAPGVRKGLGMVGIDTNEAGGKGGYATSYADRVKKMTERASRFGQNKARYEAELEKEVRKLRPEDQENLARASKAFNDAKKAKDENDTTENKATYNRAKKDFDDLMKPLKKTAEERAGKDYKDDYAKSLITPGWHNLGGITSGVIPGHISRADREAYSKIHSDKNDGGKVSDLIGMELKDLPEDRRWSTRAKTHVPKTSGNFDTNDKAWWTDSSGREKQYEILDFSPDGTQAYLKGVKDPVNLPDLHEEKAQVRAQQAQQNQNNLATGVLAGAATAGQAGAGVQQQPQQQTPRTPTDQVFTVNSRGTTTRANQQAESYMNRPQELVGKTLVNNNGEEFVVMRVDVDQSKPSGGVVVMRRADGSSMPMSYDDFRKPETINTYSVKPVPVAQAQPTQAQPNLNPVVSYTPSTTPPNNPSGPTTPPPPKPPSPPSGGTPSASPAGGRGSESIIPPSDIPINRLTDAERAARFAPPPAPQRYTDRTSEIVDMHEQPDGSYSTTPAASSELAQEMKGLRTDVANLQNAVTRSTQPKPQSYVQPPPKQVTWTPKPPAASFSIEQKNQLKRIVTEAVDHRTEELGEKLTAIEHLSHKDDIKTRKEWLEKESKRILNNVDNPSQSISTNENPPPAPPQTPEDTK